LSRLADTQAQHKRAGHRNKGNETAAAPARVAFLFLVDVCECLCRFPLMRVLPTRGKHFFCFYPGAVRCFLRFLSSHTSSLTPVLFFFAVVVITTLQREGVCVPACLSPPVLLPPYAPHPFLRLPHTTLKPNWYC
jgi:hypothetical protein